MSKASVSLRDLVFVRNVLIPRVVWVSGEEVDELVRLRGRLDVLFEEFNRTEQESANALAGGPTREAAPC